MWLDHAKLKVAGELRPGDEFEYVFDLGDNWRHRCAVDAQTADPLQECGAIPERPLVVSGCGSIPDQYGRVSVDDDGE